MATVGSTTTDATLPVAGSPGGTGRFSLGTGFGGALLTASLLFVGGLNWYSIRRQERCCTTLEHRTFIYLWPLVSVGLFLVLYLVINNLVIPWLYEASSRAMAPL